MQAPTGEHAIVTAAGVLGNRGAGSGGNLAEGAGRCRESRQPTPPFRGSPWERISAAHFILDAVAWPIKIPPEARRTCRSTGVTQRAAGRRMSPTRTVHTRGRIQHTGVAVAAQTDAGRRVILVRDRRVVKGSCTRCRIAGTRSVRSHPTGEGQGKRERCVSGCHVRGTMAIARAPFVSWLPRL